MVSIASICQPARSGAAKLPPDLGALMSDVRY